MTTTDQTPALDLDAIRARTANLIHSTTEIAQEIQDHDHPASDDLYCLNLTCVAGERMHTVLHRLAAEVAEVDRLRAQLDAIHALHTDSPAGVCPSCYRLTDASDTDDGLVDWPCPTLRAMGVEASAEAAALPGAAEAGAITRYLEGQHDQALREAEGR